MLDTNILARLADQGDPKHNESKNVVRALQQEGHLLAFNPQIKREFLDIAERPKGAGPGKNGLGLSIEQARILITLFKSQFAYRPDIPEIDRQFDGLHEKYGGGKTVHDLNIVASMKSHGIQSILTYNERDFAPFRDEGHISVLTPSQILQKQNS